MLALDRLVFLEREGQVGYRWGRRMKVIAFLTEHAVVDRIIRHLKLTFAAEKPPPCHVLSEVALMAAEESGDYE
jgi:hypothetical protein